MSTSISKSNRDVYLNFGLIAYGPLSEIEKLQRMIDEDCKELKLVYQTVSAKRLFLKKQTVRRDSGRDERERENGEAAAEG